MATSAFRSSSRRESFSGSGDAGSSNRIRRSRSLSRYSGRFPPPAPEPDEEPTPRGKFVNKKRGSGFPEISLDDLADEFFGPKGEMKLSEEETSRSDSARTGRTGRTGRGSGEARFLMETASSRRRGRSVSRHQDGSTGERKGSVVSRPQRQRSLSVANHRRSNVVDEKNRDNGVPRQNELSTREGKGQFGNDPSSRLQRSTSGARYHSADLENEWEKFLGISKASTDSEDCQHLSSEQQSNSHLFRRTMSQKDMSQLVDNCSSHSSSITDDELHDGRSHRTGLEKTIRAIYTQEKVENPTREDDEPGLYKAVRNEVRSAFQEMKTELEKAMVKKEPSSLVNDNNQSQVPNSVNVIAEVRRSYTSKLEESEKRKHELLAELVAEEQRGQELTNIVRELLPAPVQTDDHKRPLRPRRRSGDRTRMSRRLDEEAERYFEDFLSNVEDTDYSSFDGERSDTSSTLGGSTKLREHTMLNASMGMHQIPVKADSLPTETDGVLLPWLQWETSNDVSPSPPKSKGGPETSLQEASYTAGRSSFGSWSPNANHSPSIHSSNAIASELAEVRSSYLMSSTSSTLAAGVKSSFDMDEYLNLQSREDLLFETWRQRHRIESGSLILCGRI